MAFGLSKQLTDCHYLGFTDGHSYGISYGQADDVAFGLSEPRTDWSSLGCPDRKSYDLPDGQSYVVSYGGTHEFAYRLAN